MSGLVRFLEANEVSRAGGSPDTALEMRVAIVFVLSL